MSNRFGLAASLLFLVGLGVSGKGYGFDPGRGETASGSDVHAVERAVGPDGPLDGQVSFMTGRKNQKASTGLEVLTTSSRRSAISVADISRLIEQLAKEHGLDVDLVHAVIGAESGYDASAVSAAGAIGLMQVMPATAADYGVRSVDALFEPTTNLDTGMRHLSRLLDRYRSIGQAVMAYNAGEGALERSGGFVGYAETQRYTHAVVVSYLRRIGIAPYTPDARRVIGLDVTPDMANAADIRGRSAADNRRVVTKPEKQQAPPVTRLSSRLSPKLSRQTEQTERGIGLNRSGYGVLERNRDRVASQDR
jgi:hypothetical protein